MTVHSNDPVPLARTTTIYRPAGGVEGNREVHDKTSSITVSCFPWKMAREVRMQPVPACYILADHASVYIGETNDVHRRLADHVRDSDKSFAREAYVVTGVGSEGKRRFNSTAAVYFQYHLTHLALQANLVDVIKGSNPQLPDADEHESASLDVFLQQSQSLLFDAGCRAFKSSHIVIAHSAAFDRKVAERHWPFFANCHWACSATGIDWKAHGLGGARLAYLLSECGLFHDAHRALDDCHAVLEILALNLPGTEQSGLAALLDRARRPQHRIWADGAPFALKDALKQRGYRWNFDRARRQLTVIGKRNKLRVIDLEDADEDLGFQLFCGLPATIETKALFWHRPPAGKLAPGEPGARPYSQISSNFRRVVKATAAQAQKQAQHFRPFTFHHLRHVHAVNWLKSGRSIYALQQRLGHTSVKTTEMYLAYLTAEEKQNVMFGTARTGTKTRTRTAVENG